ncbi:MAG: hypothetical protein AMJ53_02215 [Gammaproteobacteria bacterium SG8_11]|nr:MAG: hypothetical protein AMJ53_02215 [Gammaproteobacteria bacterium SG8_11]
MSDKYAIDGDSFIYHPQHAAHWLDAKHSSKHVYPNYVHRLRLVSIVVLFQRWTWIGYQFDWIPKSSSDGFLKWKSGDQKHYVYGRGRGFNYVKRVTGWEGDAPTFRQIDSELRSKADDRKRNRH